MQCIVNYNANGPVFVGPNVWVCCVSPMFGCAVFLYSYKTLQLRFRLSVYLVMVLLKFKTKMLIIYCCFSHFSLSFVVYIYVDKTTKCVCRIACLFNLLTRKCTIYINDIVDLKWNHGLSSNTISMHYE